MSKFLRGIALAFVFFVVVSLPVLAYTYRAPFTVTENASVTYPMLSVYSLIDNEWMADNGFMRSDALDTRVETAGGTDKPHMAATDRTIAATALPADSQLNLYYAMGETPLVSMDIIPGFANNSSVGYIEVLDAANLELAGNFTAIINDIYLDTDAAFNKYIIYKQDSISLYVDNATSGKIEVNLADQPPTSTSIYTNAAGDFTALTPVGGANWACVQTYDGDTSYVWNNVAGDWVWDAYNLQDPSLPAGAVITDLEVTMIVRAAYVASVAYRSGLRLSGSNTYGAVHTDSVATYHTFTDTVARPGGGSWSEADLEDLQVILGLDWISQQPLCSQIYVKINYYIGGATLSVSGIPSGEYDLSLAANTTDLILNVGGTSNSTAFTSTVPDSANNWLYMTNNSSVYAGNITSNIDGIQQLLFEPNDMIVTDDSDNLTANLPDRGSDGTANNGTIYWGGLPTGADVTIGSLVAYSAPSLGVEEEKITRDVLPTTSVSDWYGDGTVSKAATLANPIRVVVTVVSDNTTLTEIQVWRLYGLILWLFVTVAAGFKLRGHLGFTLMASGATLGGLVAFDGNIFPMWLLVVTIGCFIGGFVAERSPSL